ncbi:MAG: GlsB/YeaQ/YmgE family stress response membrane protein [bacterium]
MIGGWIFRTFGHAGVTGLNLWSIVAAAIGAIVLLWLLRCSPAGGRPARCSSTASIVHAKVGAQRRRRWLCGIDWSQAPSIRRYVLFGSHHDPEML